jgi:hypothetical protein
MPTAEGVSVSTLPDDRNDGYGSIVSDIAALVEQVRASMKRIDQAIALEPDCGIELDCDDVVVLDDITPRYRNARAALTTCYTGLGAALSLLLDAKAPARGAVAGRRADETAEYDLEAVRSLGRA